MGGDGREAITRRNNTFKLIPRISEGSWIIKQSVGTTPCLLGNKLTARYFQCAAPPFRKRLSDQGSRGD